MNTADNQLILAACSITGNLSEADEQFLDEVSHQVLDRGQELTPQQRQRVIQIHEENDS